MLDWCYDQLEMPLYIEGDGFMYITEDGQTSGNWNTAIDNSLFNMARWIMCLLQCFGYRADLSNSSDVRFNIYSDDSLIGFTPQWLQEHGGEEFVMDKITKWFKHYGIVIECKFGDILQSSYLSRTWTSSAFFAGFVPSFVPDRVGKLCYSFFNPPKLSPPDLVIRGISIASQLSFNELSDGSNVGELLMHKLRPFALDYLDRSDPLDLRVLALMPANLRSLQLWNFSDPFEALI